MKRTEFESLLQGLQEEELEINRTKGREYALGDEDALLNFKIIGGMLGVSPLMVCSVYLLKHILGMMSYVQQGHALSEEGARGRVNDVRLYCALFLGLINE